MKETFSYILRKKLVNIGVPAVGSIVATPLIVLIARSDLASSISASIMALYAIYFALTLHRPVVKSEAPDNVQTMILYSSDKSLQHYRRSNTSRNDTVKRIVDVTLAVLMIIALAPLLIALSVMILLQGRPLLIRHRRVGRGGQLFPCLKFRTMVPDAEAVLMRHLASDINARAEWSSSHKLKQDPRVTWLGRLLRKSSLDELPQLINVLRGEMSVVGPRPIVPAETVFYGNHLDQYTQVRPGLTGAWQVQIHNRKWNSTTYAYRVAADVKYAKEHTIYKDFAILFRTFPAVMQYRVEYTGEETLENVDISKLRSINESISLH